MSVAPSTIELTNKQEEAPMDQTETSYPTIINVTEDFLKSQVAEKEQRILELESHIQRVTTRDYSTRAELVAMRDQMQEWALGALETGTINETEAEEIAEICGFDLTKEFEVEVEVQYSITVNARDEESAKNSIYDIDFDTVQYDSDNITYLSSSVDRVDI
jgi:hypothetical protein